MNGPGSATALSKFGVPVASCQGMACEILIMRRLYGAVVLPMVV